MKQLKDLNPLEFAEDRRDSFNTILKYARAGKFSKDQLASQIDQFEMWIKNPESRNYFREKPYKKRYQDFEYIARETRKRLENIRRASDEEYQTLAIKYSAKLLDLWGELARIISLEIARMQPEE